MTRIRSFSIALLALLALTACKETPDIAALSDSELRQVAKAHEGGTALPAGALNIFFPWMGKQSVMCLGDSIERQIALLDFGTEDNEATGTMQFGSVSIDATRTGRGSFTAMAKQLRSGHADRDAKLLEGGWLNVEEHPKLSLEAKKITEVLPTVWKIEGTWTMRGVSKDVVFLANARYVPEMKYVGKGIARVSGSFRMNLKEHGMDNGTVGTAACAADWTVDFVFLGKINPTKEK